MTELNRLKLDDADLESLLKFFAETGRSREDCEAWVHALVDIRESCNRIFGEFLPEALGVTEYIRDRKEIFWDIREEIRHIEYHVSDVIGK